jgi:hypothetical protein
MAKDGGGASVAGAFWFAGWLFTIMFAELAWWKIILGIVVWPLFLGDTVRDFVVFAIR